MFTCIISPYLNCRADLETFIMANRLLFIFYLEKETISTRGMKNDLDNELIITLAQLPTSIQNFKITYNWKFTWILSLYCMSLSFYMIVLVFFTFFILKSSSCAHSRIYARNGSLFLTTIDNFVSQTRSPLKHYGPQKSCDQHKR